MKTLVIEGQLDGLNEYTAACRAYKMAGARMKKKNQAHISLYIRNQLDGFSVDGQAALRFRWYEPNRKRDLDNVCFAKKFILDELVSAGVIASDGWRGVVGFEDRFYLDKENPRIEVDIMKAEEYVWTT